MREFTPPGDIPRSIPSLPRRHAIGTNRRGFMRSTGLVGTGLLAGSGLASGQQPVADDSLDLQSISTSTASTSAMAYLFYSDGITGSSTAAGHEDSSDVVAIDWPVNEDGTSLTIQKPVDTASVPLYQLLAEEGTLSEVTLELYRVSSSGAEEHYFTVTFEEAAVTSIELTAPQMVFSPHHDVITFEGERITVEHEVEGQTFQFEP